MLNSPSRAWSARNGTAFSTSQPATLGSRDAVWRNGDLAVRVVRHPVARGSCSAVTFGSGRRLANALWTDAECPSDPVSVAGFAEGD